VTDQESEFVERANCISCGATDLSELSSGYLSEELSRGFIENDPWGESPLPHVEFARWEFVRCESCSRR
jgi:hypothetical protein